MSSKYTNLSKEKLGHHLTLDEYITKLQKLSEKGYGNCIPVFSEKGDNEITHIVEYCGETGYCSDFGKSDLEILNDWESTERENIVYIN